MTYRELQAALEVFRLGKDATRQDIERRHHELVKQHHPDAGGEGTETIAAVNVAHQVLQTYIGAYRFSFSEDEFYHQNPEERIRQQFSHDPIWGTMHDDGK